MMESSLALLTPVRARSVEDALAGEKPDADAIAKACGRIVDDIGEPREDVHGTADYRRALASVLAQRAIGEAAGRASNRG